MDRLLFFGVEVNGVRRKKSHRKKSEEAMGGATVRSFMSSCYQEMVD